MLPVISIVARNSTLMPAVVGHLQPMSAKRKVVDGNIEFKGYEGKKIEASHTGN